MLFFRLSNVVQATGYGLFVYFVIYRVIAREDVFLTYLLNIALIILALFLDTLAHRFALKRASDIREMYEGMNVVSKAVYLLGQGFIRTSMYMFYIVVLVLSRVAILRPELIPFGLQGFILSIEYGIILLIVFDKLKGLLIEDKRWFQKMMGVGPEQSANDSYDDK